MVAFQLYQTCQILQYFQKVKIQWIKNRYLINFIHCTIDVIALSYINVLFRAHNWWESCLFKHNPYIEHCECNGKLIEVTDTCPNNIVEKSKLWNVFLLFDIEKIRSKNGSNIRLNTIKTMFQPIDHKNI